MANHEPTPHCLVVAANAEQLAAEIHRLGGPALPLRACPSVATARASKSDETVLLGDPKMLAELLPLMPGVRWVQSTWAGVKPLIAGPRRDYRLTGIKGVFGVQMAEYALGYLLAHELRIAERRQAQRSRRWLSAASGTLSGKTLGIMGTGSIGARIAHTAAGFGMTVRGLSRRGLPVDGFERVDTLDRLPAFLDSLDYVVCTLPDTEATFGILNADTLALLPDHAALINVGRANVIDHVALAEALRGNRLGAAVLDVFTTEPLPADSELWATPNLTITAHVAAVSHPELIAPLFLDNYQRYVSGRPLLAEVDFDVGY